MLKLNKMTLLAILAKKYAMNNKINRSLLIKPQQDLQKKACQKSHENIKSAKKNPSQKKCLTPCRNSTIFYNQYQIIKKTTFQTAKNHQ